MSLKVEIPMRILSLNKFTRGTHWKYEAYRRKWFKVLPLFIRSQTKAPDELRTVKIIRYGLRLYDDDNFIAGCKPLRDFLKGANVIRDDSEKWLRAIYVQFPVKKKNEERVVIEVV